MACNYNVKVVEGNKFALVMPLKRRSYVSSIPIDEDIDATELVNCHVTIGGMEYTPAFGSEGVRVIVPATLARGTYDVVLTATYHGAEIRAAYFEGLTIVKWNGQSDAQQYVQGTTVELVPAFVIGGTLTDAELEQLKAQLRLDIDAAEEAEAEAIAEKEKYAEAVRELDDLATEPNATANKQAVLDALAALQAALQGSNAQATLTALKTAIDNINIDTTELAKQGDNPDATLTETQAQATSAATDAAAAKAAAQAIVIPTDYAKEAAATTNKEAIITSISNAVASILGTNTAATLTAIRSLLTDNWSGLEQIRNALYYLDQSVAKEAKATQNLQDLSRQISALYGSEETTLTDVFNHVTAVLTALAPKATSAEVAAAQAAIIAAIPTPPTVAQIQNGLATEASVKDGNDTAIAMLKNATYGLAMLAKEANATNNKDQLAGLINSTLASNIVTTGIMSMAGIQIVDVPVADTTITALPNRLYRITGRTGTGAADLTISFGDDPDIPSTEVKEWHFLFEGGATSTITWGNFNNNAVIWQQGLPPQLSGGQNFYEVGILNGVGLWMSYAASNN